MKKLFLVVALIAAGITGRAEGEEEGMYPLSMISKLNLKAAGLQIDPEEIFNPGKGGLVDALVRLGGCTGSFVSENGLIVTNHHCAFGAVAAASTPEQNYLEDGFYASAQEKEVKTSLTCKITMSYEDVSAVVLNGVTTEMNGGERGEIIQKNIQALLEKEREQYPELTIEVSEMYIGKFYTLFRYKTLDDIRLVYVPPRSIGEFGGETDNWIWPRHTGDFSFVRAYENDKPYHPDNFLKINASGTEEGDFTFVLGYPGRTYRHQPGEFLTYQNEHILPVIADWFDFKIEAMEKAGVNNKSLELQLASKIKSHANVTKNFKGKMQGFRRTDVIANRYAEQKELQNALAKNKSLNEKYGPLFTELDATYSEILRTANRDLMLRQLRYNSSGVFYAATVIAETQLALEKMNKEERAVFLTEKKDDLYNELNRNYRIYDADLDFEFFAGALERLYNLPKELQPMALVKYVGGKHWDEFEIKLKEDFFKSDLVNREATNELFNSKLEKCLKQDDPIISLAKSLIPLFKSVDEKSQISSEKLAELLPKLADLKAEVSGDVFIPDANGTLRFTYGYIKGYNPEDAVYYSPQSTLPGIFEKAATGGDYQISSEILEKMKKAEPADVLRHKTKHEVVVGILYDMDTTGGNSGSPILNAKGELIGVNFDRAYTATINDFAWNESYSRSIGVDIRYVLFVMKYVNQADRILTELKVNI